MKRRFKTPPRWRRRPRTGVAKSTTSAGPGTRNRASCTGVWRLGTPVPPVAIRTEPRFVMVNDVYVVDDDRCDDDVFRADNLWWRLRGGYWYRAASWRGPWLAVDVRRVPERVLVVPARHWKHHPRHDGRMVIVEHDRGRHEGEHHGHGHGHGHGDHDED